MANMGGIIARNCSIKAKINIKQAKRRRDAKEADKKQEGKNTRS